MTTAKLLSTRQAYERVGVSRNTFIVDAAKLGIGPADTYPGYNGGQKWRASDVDRIAKARKATT